jgi:hypothetical protein
MQIVDGQGRGNMAGVTNSHALQITGSTGSFEHEANHRQGLAFNALFAQTPSGGDDCVFYMENTGDLDLSIEGITLSVADACDVYIQIDATGTRNAASDVTPANLNGGSGKQADGDFEQGADLAGGAATLAGGVECERYRFYSASGTDSKHFNFNQDIILPTNHTMTVWVSAAVAVMGTVVFNYHDVE